MRQAGHLHAAALALCRAVLAQVYDASEQLRGLLQTDALGALGMAGSEPLDEEQLESSRLLWVLWNFDSGGGGAAWTGRLWPIQQKAKLHSHP